MPSLDDSGKQPSDRLLYPGICRKANSHNTAIAAGKNSSCLLPVRINYRTLDRILKLNGSLLIPHKLNLLRFVGCLLGPQKFEVIFGCFILS